ncbi:hypothetical protein [Brumimicrobium oceani]|uniref:DUF4836 domain-containing protein n=1 Tax=Brumimicrobium oceani TaxID=2100725 RepID=A0A2U2XD53_9FLAO|nr:hypothetical protein [Brumimicrobium oceani]PWH85726.1 hypothetical protein DIT68_08825 [Brumimicrobium oceani]
MKKIITALLLLLSSLSLKSQVNQMISDSAYFVMEVDLGKIVKSVPLEEINKLEFVQFLLKEFDDGKNKINNLSGLGVDFSAKLTVFNLEREMYNSVSVILPIKDKQKFIQLFSSEQQALFMTNGAIARNDLFISLTESACVISKINWNTESFREKTRLIFEDKGWELPENYYFYNEYDYIEDDFYNIEETEEIIEYEAEETISEYEVQQMELESKFQHILDSITTIEKTKIVKQHQNFINSPKNNLYSNDELYRKISQQTSDAKIYMNPLMNINLMSEFMYYPIRGYMEDELKEMRQFAYLNFTPEGIELDWKIQVSEDLAEVMKAGSSKKIDKNLLKYIPDYAQGIALYNINGFGAYEKFKEIYMPKLDESENAEMLLASAIWSTLDEFIDVEAVSSVYPPKILVSYAGFKEVELSRVTYAYDEETFEYSEVDTTYMEKIPMMTFALANEHAFLIEKYLKALQKLESDKVIKNGTYYTIIDGPMQLGISYYIAIKDNIIIVTNDESVVTEHLNGYSKKAFDRKTQKKIKNAKLFYAHMDFSSIAEDIVDLGFIYKTDEYLEAFHDKTGKVEIEMTSISKNQAHYKVNINTNEKYENGGFFLFELMNAIYLYNK